MKLPANLSKIVGKTYKGQKDDEGRPHGNGVMEFFTQSEKKYKYEGHFEHGVRTGYGVWYENIQLIHEYEPWEWAQMGDYDSVGRLIHPNTKPGPRKEVRNYWDEKFRGWWRNDDAVQDFRNKKYGEDEFEFTEDKSFLSHFHDFRAVRKLPVSIVSKFSIAQEPYARYAYAAWLWASNQDSHSLKTVFSILEDTARAGIPDAFQLLSRMYYLGEAYDVKTDKFIMDRELSKELHARAIEKGSILAKLRRNKNLFYGTPEVEAEPDAAIAEAERESSAIFSESILWTEQLGWYYQSEGEYEKAIKAFEKCIANGYFSPLFDLAVIYLNEDDKEYYDYEYYKTLMKVGIRLGVPECHILGIEREPQWDSLEDYEKNQLHSQLKKNLEEGISMRSGYCAYTLADMYLNGKLGFNINFGLGKEYADIAVTYGYNEAFNLLIEAAETLQDPEFMTEEELLRYRILALRYGIDEQLDYVIRNKETYIEMGYGDEINKVWMPLWKKNHPEAKTQVSPSVIIIQPSGVASVIEADVFCMSYREMSQLIDAEGLDAVHFSESLNKITKACRFRGYQVAMYADRNGYAKDLADNAIGTMLYGTGAEIRGAVIIALEDNKFDTHSFHFQEDLDKAFAAISDLTGGLIRHG